MFIARFMASSNDVLSDYHSLSSHVRYRRARPRTRVSTPPAPPVTMRALLVCVVVALRATAVKVVESPVADAKSATPSAVAAPFAAQASSAVPPDPAQRHATTPEPKREVSEANEASQTGSKAGLQVASAMQVKLRHRAKERQERVAAARALRMRRSGGRRRGGGGLHQNMLIVVIVVTGAVLLVGSAFYSGVDAGKSSGVGAKASVAQQPSWQSYAPQAHAPPQAMQLQPMVKTQSQGPCPSPRMVDDDGAKHADQAAQPWHPSLAQWHAGPQMMQAETVDVAGVDMPVVTQTQPIARKKVVQFASQLETPSPCPSAHECVFPPPQRLKDAPPPPQPQSDGISPRMSLLDRNAGWAPSQIAAADT